MPSSRVERLGLVVLEVEERDGFVGVSVPSSARVIVDDAVKASLLRGLDLRLASSKPPAPASIVAILADPFPVPLPPRGQPISARPFDDVLAALETRQPRSHRVGPAWHTDRRAVRALDDALRSMGVVTPVVSPDDEAPPTADPPTLAVAITERAVWPDQPRPPAAPEHLPLANEAGEWLALGAWPTVLLDALSSASAPARDALRSVAERLEAVGDLRRALIAAAALGDDGARERLLGSPHAPRLLRWPVAAFASDPGQRDRLRRFARDEAIGKRLALAEALETIAVDERDAGIAELAATVRASLAQARSLVLEIAGEEQRFVLTDAVTLGRASADVVVPGSLVSRHHLGFRRVDGVPVVTDLGSHNGTEIDGGGRLTGALAITAELRLRLGGGVPCAMAPHRHGVILEVAGSSRVLTLGPLTLGTLTLSASRGAVVCSGEGTFDGRPFSGAVELALGDVLRDAEGLEIRVAQALSRRSA